MPDPIRVLIADDHEVVRQGLRLILEEEEFVVAGEASDGADAVRLAGELKPEVVLMDLRMPGMGGLEAIAQIRSEWPEIAIVILTTYDEDELMLRGLRAGARGFLLKDTRRQVLCDTLRAAARGETLLLPEVMARVMNQPPEPPENVTSPSAKALSLTERERQVLRGVAKGERSKEIAK